MIVLVDIPPIIYTRLIVGNPRLIPIRSSLSITRGSNRLNIQSFELTNQNHVYESETLWYRR